MSFFRYRITRYPLIALAVVLALFAICVPLDLGAQWVFAAIVSGSTLVLSRVHSRKIMLSLAILSMLVSTRYLFWRTTQTLRFGTFPELLLGSGLYLAELYAWIILILGNLQTGWPLIRPVIEIPGEPEQWPFIDVYIPTYNESLALVRTTVLAAMDMDYPPDRFRVFILDDGRRSEFQSFARQAGCGYLTRADNLHAKAGNLNAALKKTDGTLIAIFDCDHVPTRAFLQLSVGWFLRDPGLALLQTPHHFYSPDPAQRNLGTVRDLPGEGDLFYGAVQAGNDLWNATFFCGSCAIIRREALADTNGFAGETVTEDAHTALKLQRMGWRTAYISARLSAGLATERLVVHIGQRIRWARGMTQILRIDNPLFGPGLTWQQRLCYLNAMLHFQFPLPRIVFLTSPLAYLIFGQNIIHASASLIFAYAAPHLFCAMTTENARAGAGDRRPFWGEIYETILAFHLVAPTAITLFQPRKGKFNVTDKGSLLDRTHFDLTTVRPHLICIALLVLGIALGFVKLLVFPYLFNIQADTLGLNVAWAVFSLVLLLAAVSVARETRQVREYIRIPAELPVTVYLDDGHVFDATTTDISMGGVEVALPTEFPIAGRQIEHISLPMGDEKLTIPVNTIRVADGRAQLQFHPLDLTLTRHLVRAVMGRADAWQPVAPRPSVSALRSLWDIMVIDAVTLSRLIGLNRGERRKPKPTPATGPKRAAGAAAAAIFFAFALAGTSGPAKAQPSASTASFLPSATTKAFASPADSAPNGLRHQRLSLRDLQIRTPIRLAGTQGEIGIPFGMRANEVVSQASLTLNFAWSPALLGDVSQLVVLLNGEVITTIRLQPDNAAGQTLTIPVDPALFLPGDNRLNLRLIGHYTRDCEDPFHSALWANVSNVRSWFDLTIQTLPLVPDLARLPGPFFDRHDNLPLQLPFVFAGPPAHGELEAAASIASWFGGMTSYRGASFKPAYGQIPHGNAIVFLTPDRPIAGLAGLLAGPITGPGVAVIRNPGDPWGQLLVIMGRGPEDLKLAAAAIANGRGVFGGQQMSLDGVRIPVWPRYSAPRWLSSSRKVQLGEIMDATALQGMGLPPGPLSARFHLAPDLFFWPQQGGTLNLRYRYPVAQWLDRRASRLDISLNNQYLHTEPLAGSGWWDWLKHNQGASTHESSASIPLPRYNLFGQNELIFDYNLIIADKQKCTGTLPANVRVSLLPTSTIDLSHAYHSLRMPDLATFASAGYPFTIRPDQGETVVLMGPQPSPGAVAAFLTLMGRFGDATGAPSSAITVVDAIDPDAMAGKDILVIGPSGLAATDALFANAPVHWRGGRLQVDEASPLERIFADASPFNPGVRDEAAHFLTETSNFSGIVAFQSPFESGRSVIALLANDPEDLPALVEGMAEPRINAQIQGDLAVTTGDGITSFAVGPGYRVGHLPLLVEAGYWLSGRPELMALGGLLAALLLGAPLYLYLARREHLRLDKDDTE